MKIEVTFKIEQKDWETEVDIKKVLNEIANIFGYRVMGVASLSDTEKKEAKKDPKQYEFDVREAVDTILDIMEDEFEDDEFLLPDLVNLLRGLPADGVEEVIRRVERVEPEFDIDCVLNRDAWDDEFKL